MKNLTYEEKKNYISQALFERKGLDQIVNAAATVFNNSIFVNDRSFKIISKSNVLVDDQINWSILFPNNQMEIESANKVEESGIYKHILKSDEPIYGSFDFFDYPFLGSRIRDKEGMVAMATMIIKNKISSEDEQLFKFFCQVVFYELLYTNRTGMQKVPYFNLLSDLLHESISKDETEQRIGLLHLSVPNTMRCVIFEYKNNPGLSLYYMRDSISSLFPFSFMIIYEDRLLLILDAKEYKEKNFESILACHSFRIGVSKTFNHLFELNKYYNQSILALKLQDKIISYYEEVAFYDLLNSTSIEKCRECIHPALFILKRHDTTHSVSLFETLEVFLNNNQNIQTTSSLLHIHRSSLYTRLEKIKELTCIDLENGDTVFLLSLSYKIYHFIY